MEDVIEVYTRPRDPNRPLVCLDESSKQLIAETRVPIPMKPGRAARVWLSALNGITRPSTAVGLISQNPNSAFYPLNASTAASPTNRPSSTKSTPGIRSEMPITPRQTGTSPPKMLALNLSTYTLQFD
jgi:hypothetical protein